MTQGCPCPGQARWQSSSGCDRLLPKASLAHDLRACCAFLKHCKNQNMGSVPEPHPLWPHAGRSPGSRLWEPSMGCRTTWEVCCLPFQEEVC